MEQVNRTPRISMKTWIVVEACAQSTPRESKRNGRMAPRRIETKTMTAKEAMIAAVSWSEL